MNSKESGREALETLILSEIENMSVLKRENVIEKYGDRAEDGVVDLSTKK